MKDEISNKRIQLLHPKVRDEVMALMNNAEYVIDDNLAIRIVQGLRTIDEQNALYAQGRTKPGKKVTNAPGGYSYHNYGLAIDFCFLWLEDGKYVYKEDKSWLVGPNHKKVQKIFKDAGWEWGGDWKSIKDYPHFQKTFGYTEKQLLDKYNKRDFVDDTKYVNL